MRDSSQNLWSEKCLYHQRLSPASRRPEWLRQLLLTFPTGNILHCARQAIRILGQNHWHTGPALDSDFFFVDLFLIIHSNYSPSPDSPLSFFSFLSAPFCLSSVVFRFVTAYTQGLGKGHSPSMRYSIWLAFLVFLLFDIQEFSGACIVTRALMWTHGAGSLNEDNDLELFRARLSYMEFFGGKQYIHTRVLIQVRFKAR
jgi:hypothetical protein